MKAELQTRKKRQNLYGQAMGDKGASTREKILKATSMLMEKRGIRDLKVTEIGASAGVSSSTFYLYFEGVPQACLAVTKRINQSSPEILEILNRDWDASNIEENAKTFVKAYLAFWDSHSAILRLRNFAADEGDREFFEARKISLEPIHYGLQRQLKFFQQNDPHAPKLHIPSTASILLAMLERTAAVVRIPSTHKATRPRMLETAAFMITSTLTCPGNN